MARIPLGHLSKGGFDVRALLADLGLGPTEIFDPEATIPTATLYALYRKAEALTGDPALGAHLAEWVDFALLESLRAPGEYFPVQTVLASPTLGEGLERLAALYPLGFGNSRLWLDRAGGELRMRHEVVGEPAPQALCEFMVSWWSLLIMHVTAKSVSPLAIRFARGAPDSTAEHERVLGQRPRFDAGEDGLSLDLSALDTPVRCSDPRLLGALEGHARQLADGAEDAALISRVRALLGKLCSQPEALAVETVARALGLSVRTLTRRLSGQGTSYRKLLDEVRGEAARSHFAAGRSVTEVAELLGFSEPGAFHRAFVRWFGRPPSDHGSCLIARRPSPPGG